MQWSSFFYVLGALLMGWLVYRNVRTNPQAFSAKSLGKSAQTLAVLALLLIAFIAFCILLLKQN